MTTASCSVVLNTTGSLCLSVCGGEDGRPGRYKRGVLIGSPSDIVQVEGRPVPGEVVVLILDIKVIDHWFLLHGLGPAASRTLRSARIPNTFHSYNSIQMDQHSHSFMSVDNLPTTRASTFTGET